jgi:hypothetical protein
VRSRRPRKVLPRAETRENFNKKMLSQDIIIFFSFHFSLQRIMKNINIILPLSLCPARALSALSFSLRWQSALLFKLHSLRSVKIKELSNSLFSPSALF